MTFKNKNKDVSNHVAHLGHVPNTQSKRTVVHTTKVRNGGIFLSN